MSKVSLYRPIDHSWAEHWREPVGASGSRLSAILETFSKQRQRPAITVLCCGAGNGLISASVESKLRLSKDFQYYLGSLLG